MTDKDSEEAFARFLRQGGLPGIHAISPDDTPVFEYLRAIADTVVLRDVVARHDVRNVRLLEDLLRHVLDTSGSPLSARRITDSLKSQQIKTGVETVIDCLLATPETLERELRPLRRIDDNSNLRNMPMHMIPPTAISCGTRFLATTSGGVKAAPRGMKCIGRLRNTIFSKNRT